MDWAVSNRPSYRLYEWTGLSLTDPATDCTSGLGCLKQTQLQTVRVDWAVSNRPSYRLYQCTGLSHTDPVTDCTSGLGCLKRTQLQTVRVDWTVSNRHSYRLYEWTGLSQTDSATDCTSGLGCLKHTQLQTASFQPCCLQKRTDHHCSIWLCRRNGMADDDDDKIKQCDNLRLLILVKDAHLSRCLLGLQLTHLVLNQRLCNVTSHTLSASK